MSHSIHLTSIGMDLKYNLKRVINRELTNQCYVINSDILFFYRLALIFIIGVHCTPSLSVQLQNTIE